MNCPQCGTPAEPGAAFCDNCGAALAGMAPPPPAFSPARQSTQAAGGLCPQCGQAVMPGEAFCENCGAALPATSAAPAQSPAPTPWPAAPPPQPVPPAGGGQTCPSCGMQTPPGAAFCDNCGAPLTAAAPQPPPSQPFPAPPQPAAPAGGATCPNCGAQTTPGAVFCDNCGASLTAASPPPGQQPAPRPYQPPIQPPVAAGPPPRLVVQSTNASLPFPAGKTEIIAGREDPVSNVFPEVNLDPHGGDEGGVSRRHAKFTLQGSQWYLQDLNSTNFTFVNKQKLQPNQPHPVNHGDEVRLGRVVLTFFTS